MFKIILSIFIMVQAYGSQNIRDIEVIEQSLKQYAEQYSYQDGTQTTKKTRYLERGVGKLKLRLHEIDTQTDLDFIFQIAFDDFIGILQTESIQAFRDHIIPLIEEYLGKKNSKKFLSNNLSKDEDL